jgi:proteasome lid subunit RPN8/RPN11
MNAYRVHFAKDFLARLFEDYRRDSLDRGADKETAWIVLGRRLGWDVTRLEDFIGAGPEREATSTSVIIDHRYVNHHLRTKLWEDPGLSVLGTVHTHPQGPILPSSRDYAKLHAWIQGDDVSVFGIAVPQVMRQAASLTVGDEATVAWYVLQREMPFFQGADVGPAR